MALLDLTKSWIGVARRADEPIGKNSGWYPQPYVRIDLEGQVVNVSAYNAKKLAKAITAAANVIEPPTPRKRKAATRA